MIIQNHKNTWYVFFPKFYLQILWHNRLPLQFEHFAPVQLVCPWKVEGIYQRMNRKKIYKFEVRSKINNKCWSNYCTKQIYKTDVEWHLFELLLPINKREFRSRLTWEFPLLVFQTLRKIVLILLSVYSHLPFPQLSILKQQDFWSHVTDLKLSSSNIKKVSTNTY